MGNGYKCLERCSSPSASIALGANSIERMISKWGHQKELTIRSGHGGSFSVQIFESGLLPWDHKLQQLPYFLERWTISTSEVLILRTLLVSKAIHHPFCIDSLDLVILVTQVGEHFCHLGQHPQGQKMEVNGQVAVLSKDVKPMGSVSIIRSMQAHPVSNRWQINMLHPLDSWLRFFCCKSESFPPAALLNLSATSWSLPWRLERHVLRWDI